MHTHSGIPPLCKRSETRKSDQSQTYLYENLTRANHGFERRVAQWNNFSWISGLRFLNHEHEKNWTRHFQNFLATSTQMLLWFRIWHAISLIPILNYLPSKTRCQNLACCQETWNVKSKVSVTYGGNVGNEWFFEGSKLGMLHVRAWYMHADVTWGSWEWVRGLNPKIGCFR